MILLRYLNEKEKYLISFRTVSQNIVQIIGDFPVKTVGFTLSREGREDNWDYSGYTTVYREIDGGVQFSNDGSVYVEPIPPTPPEPYIPTLEEVKAQKVTEMNSVQQMTIQNGIDVTLIDGAVEHFNLSEKDRMYLMALTKDIEQGNDKIPWYDADGNCKYYSSMDMYLISDAAKKFTTYHETYLHSLVKYIESLEDTEVVKSVYYGMYIPTEYQSEVLTDCYNEMGVTAESV